MRQTGRYNLKTKMEKVIQRLDHSIGSTGTKESVRIKRRFGNILQEIKYRDLPSEQLSLLEHEFNFIFRNLNLEGGNVEKYLRVHLEKLLKYLRINFALLPVSYYAIFGIGIGLIAGFFLLIILLVFTESSLKYYSSLGGLFLGVMVGSVYDRRQKAKGKALLALMV